MHSVARCACILTPPRARGGVQGALAFLDTEAAAYAEHFNIVCAPCVRCDADTFSTAM